MFPIRAEIRRFRGWPLMLPALATLVACGSRVIDWPTGKVGTAREHWTRWDSLWPARPEALISVQAARVETSGLPAASGWDYTGRSGQDLVRLTVREARVTWSPLPRPEPQPPAIDLERWKVDSPQALVLATARLGAGPYALDLRQRSRGGPPVWQVQDAASASCLIDAEKGVVLP